MKSKAQPEPWKGRIARKREEEEKKAADETPPAPKPQNKAQARPTEPKWKEKPS